MSRPTIHRPECRKPEQTEDIKSVRTSSLRPMFDYIKSDSSIFCRLITAIRVDKNDYIPTTDIKPILITDRKHINSCMSIMSEYLDCRDINPEYKCEELREFMLKIKCI
jgi:hypothetical protein